MVEATAAQGSYSKNPFNFKNFDLSQISVTVDVPNTIGKVKIQWTIRPIVH
jgi:hypothetical protein